MMGVSFGGHCSKGSWTDEYEDLPSLSRAENHRARITAVYLAGLPIEGARWEGAAVMVTPQGEFGQGEVSLMIGETRSMAYHEVLPYYDENELDPLIVTYMVVDAEAFHVETGDQPLVLDDAEMFFRVHDPNGVMQTSNEFGFHGSHCAELAGWYGPGGGAYWAFGARRVKVDDPQPDAAP